MNILFFLVVQFNFTLNGEYLLERDSLSEYSSMFGNFQHSFNKNFLVSSDFIFQMNSDFRGRIAHLRPQITFQGGPLVVKFADFQEDFQKSMILAVEHDIAFKRLRYIRGLSASMDFKKAKISAFSGQPFNYDYESFSFRVSNDTMDLLRGVNLQYSSRMLGFEASYVRLNRQNMPEPFAFQEIYGCSWGFDNGSWKIDLNLARKWGVDPITFKRLKGISLYTFANTIVSGVSLSLSGVYYDSINFWNYNMPPVITEKELLPGAGNSDKGLSLGAGFRAGGAYIEGSVGTVVDVDEHNVIFPDKGKAFQESYLKSDFTLGRSNYFNLKVAREYFLRVEPEYEKLFSYYLEAHGKSVLKMPIEYSLRFSWNREDSVDYSISGFGVGVEPVEGLNLGFQVERSSKKISRFDFENFWSIFEIIYRTEFGSLSLVIGNQRGGLICSGGMCRIVPSFDGVKLGLDFGF